MKKVLFASLAALGLLGISTASLEAAPTAVPQPGVSGQSDMVQTAHMRYYHHDTRRSWDRHHDGPRCRYHSYRCRYHYRGYWYASPWWTLPLVGGAIILDSHHHHHHRYYRHHHYYYR